MGCLTTNNQDLLLCTRDLLAVNSFILTIPQGDGSTAILTALIRKQRHRAGMCRLSPALGLNPCSTEPSKLRANMPIPSPMVMPQPSGRSLSVARVPNRCQAGSCETWRAWICPLTRGREPARERTSPGKTLTVLPHRAGGHRRDNKWTDLL